MVRREMIPMVAPNSQKYGLKPGANQCPNKRCKQMINVSRSVKPFKRQYGVFPKQNREGLGPVSTEGLVDPRD